MKKIRMSSEVAYFAAIALLSLAVAILTAANLGISMIVAPAYLLSLKTGVLTFVQAEYVIQAGLFIVLCIILKKFKFAYLFSFVTCLIYGIALDLWLRIAMFVVGATLTAFSVALFFKTYIYPQVYDFFVKAVSDKYGLKLSVLKTIVDLTCLTSSVIMTFVFFGEIKGIGWGTLVMALLNGTLIGFFSKLLDRAFDFQPTFRKLAVAFDLNEATLLKNEKEEEKENV